MTGPRSGTVLATLVAGAALVACQPADRQPEDADASDSDAGAADTAVVRIVARDYSFEAPEEIAPGWTTFRLENQGEETHFALLYRLPEGKTFEDVQDELAPVFDSVIHALNEGRIERQEVGERLFADMPPWAGQLVFSGGPGFVAPGGAARATMRMDPGTYVMECYVKTADGVFHSSVGMSRPLTVTEGDDRGSPPESDLEITITADSIAAPAAMKPGEHTVAVHFQGHREGTLQPNDVHLVRLEAGTSLEEVASWIWWPSVEGLRAPAPAEFVGGIQEMAAGRTGYFTVDVQPGEYAWISEQAPARGMRQGVTVE